MNRRDLTAQLAGACLACLFLRAALGPAGTLGATRPASGITDLQASLVELVLTAGLLSVILGTASCAQNVRPLAALAVGGYIVLAALWSSPVSRASMNPARSFGPDLVSGHFAHYGVYLAGPVVGALVAVAIAYALRGAGGDPGGRSAAQGEGGGTDKPTPGGLEPRAVARGREPPKGRGRPFPDGARRLGDSLSADAASDQPSSPGLQITRVQHGTGRRGLADRAEHSLELDPELLGLERRELGSLHPPLRELGVELLCWVVTAEHDMGDGGTDRPVVTVPGDHPLDHGEGDTRTWQSQTCAGLPPGVAVTGTRRWPGSHPRRPVR